VHIQVQQAPTWGGKSPIDTLARLQWARRLAGLLLSHTSALHAHAGFPPFPSLSLTWHQARQRAGHKGNARGHG